MTVYVESNFVLEIALRQQQAAAAAEVLEQAEAGNLALGIPAFSLSEPFSTIKWHTRDMERLAKPLGNLLRRRALSEVHRENVATLDLSDAFLAGFESRETEGLNLAVERILNVA